MRSDSSYAPSVPVSVYRELAAELQATKAMVDSLSAQNTHLTNQNHLLRQNIHQMVQVALQLGHSAGVAHPAEVEMTFSSPPPAEFPVQAAPQPLQSVPEPAPKPLKRPKAALSKVFTEQAGENRRYTLESSASGSLSTLWLILSIAIIIFTAFGAGFLIMRPLINDR
ncbi:hypothetical protein D0962_17265 [Leptolyngbyaceae cyanobacterium CCMR0082]|uniref:Uncharacterized protein n=2 Tax=Adonisia turfae TaxID=2950184 RepID=A0A6M0S7R4_9CYAN|nr:hypothetical protein [Adonisia turfae]NEZ56582.1 hypothetical protein [Adonisia turfae CCMR0081]NEZ64515.1 hypothetical protein [Adonisia turfae CCMR0082]